MSKQPITLESVLYTDPYFSIIYLLKEFQGRNGLTTLHFRYALCKDHGDIHPYSIATVEKDFENRLDFLYDAYIERDCVSSRSNLSNFLKILLELNIITKKKLGKKTRYKLDNIFEQMLKRKEHIESMNEYSDLHSIQNTMIYGLPTKVYNDLSHQKKKELKDTISQIQVHLESIKRIRDKHIEGYRIDIFKQELQTIVDNDLLYEYLKDKIMPLHDVIEFWSPFDEYENKSLMESLSYFDISEDIWLDSDYFFEALNKAHPELAISEKNYEYLDKKAEELIQRLNKVKSSLGISSFT